MEAGVRFDGFVAQQPRQQPRGRRGREGNPPGVLKHIEHRTSTERESLDDEEVSTPLYEPANLLMTMSRH